jgi:hypothetical protein
MTTNIREAHYICDPRNVSIKVEYLPLRSANRITFYIDKVIAFDKIYRAAPSSRKEDMHRFTQQCCEMFFRDLKEDVFADEVPAKDYLRAKYIHKTIRVVYSKAGIVVWRRNS